MRQAPTNANLRLGAGAPGVVWTSCVAFVLALFLGAVPTFAYTHFLDRNTKGEVSTAHWPDEMLPLLFSIDKEALLLDGKTPTLIAKEAAILWKQVAGSRMSLQVEALDKDINGANFTQEVTIGDRRHEIVVEQDGKILQSLGLDPDFVVAVGVPITKMNPTGKLDGPFGGPIVDAFIVINTKLAWNAARLLRILTHELGHVLGLGHSNVAHLRFFEELPLMFYDPTQQEGAVLLHADDRAGLASLYPKADFEQLYGAISGRVVRSDQTPVFGAAIFASSEKTGPIGTWTDEDGRFLLTGLPPGSYSVLARAIDGSPEVKSMKPGSHVGGLLQKATTSFCPEFFNDQVFISCRFPSTSFVPVKVALGRTTTPIVIEEQKGNPTTLPGCLLGAAPMMPLRPHGLPPLAIGTRGAACPSPPEPPPGEEPNLLETKPPEETPPEPKGPERPNKEIEVLPVCGCQATDAPVMGMLMLLGMFLLLRRAPREE